nr:C-type lectin domain family 12 member B-like [Nerophis lumbriciformis]
MTNLTHHETQQSVNDAELIERQLIRLQESYEFAVRNMTETKKQLHSEMIKQTRSNWEFEHHKRRTKDYEEQLDKIAQDVSYLKSFFPMMGANANEYQLLTPHSAVASLLIERSYLRNHSNTLKTQQDAEETLVKEKENSVKLQLKMKQEVRISDTLRRRVELLHKEEDEIIANIDVIEQSCGSCPAGWILLKSTCYYFSLPEPDAKKNWSDSRADCIDRGGDLLVIDNLQEQILISENIPKASSTSGFWWQNGFWMGLRDTQSRGTWMWINNSTVADTGYWREHQPSTIGPQTGDCAAFFYFIDTTKTWYNGNCQDHLYNWICEMVAKPLE